MKIKFILALHLEFLLNFLDYFGLRKRVKPDPSASLFGKTVIVTGSNRGIGKCILSDLVQRGARVIMACRDVEMARQVANQITGRITGARVVVYHLDLASFSSIRSFTSEVIKKEERIDLLVNNAGIISSSSRKESPDGYEISLAVNFLGTILLTLNLLEKMLESCHNSKPKIVFVSSRAIDGFSINLADMNKRNWKDGEWQAFNAYAHSKSLCMLFAYQLARRCQPLGVQIYAVDPGVSVTDIIRELTVFSTPFIRWTMEKISPFITRTPGDAGQSVMHAILKRDDDSYSPQTFFLYDGNPSSISKDILDLELGEALWNRTRLVLKHPLLDKL